MQRIAFAILVSLVMLSATDAEARIRGRRSSPHHSVPAGCSNATAQGVAEIMARLETVAHFGGNTYASHEGCGSGATPEAAYNGTCFANSGMKTVDSGVAQGKSGRWYCCRRFVK